MKTQRLVVVALDTAERAMTDAAKYQAGGNAAAAWERFEAAHAAAVCAVVWARDSGTGIAEAEAALAAVTDMADWVFPA